MKKIFALVMVVGILGSILMGCKKDEAAADAAAPAPAATTGK